MNNLKTGFKNSSARWQTLNPLLKRRLLKKIKSLIFSDFVYALNVVHNPKIMKLSIGEVNVKIEDQD